MKNNWHVDKKEVDRLVQEKLKEWHQKHIAKIELKYGNTYISYDVRDHITEQGVCILQKLFGLMGIECAVHMPICDSDERYYLCIEGENQERAAFIQKFIDNGYKLSWK